MPHPSAPLALVRRLSAVALPLAVLALAGGAQADTIQLRLGTFDDVTISGVSGGKLQFKNNSTFKTGDCPLGQVQVVRIDAVPQLQQAMEAVQKKNDRAALAKYAQALSVARRLPNAKQKAWLVPFIQFEMAASHVRQKEGLPAAMLYCELMQATTDSAYFEELPEVLVKDLDEVARKALFDHIKAIRAKVPADNRVWLDKLQAATGIVEEAPVPTPGQPGDRTPTEQAPDKTPSKTPSKGGVVNVQPGALVLPQAALRFIRENGADVPDLKSALAGQYSAAAKAMEKALEESSDNTALRLFVMGRVQQEMAKLETDAAAKAAMLQEATLAFARLAAQFRDNTLYQPSLLELAYVQRELGHELTAQRMFKDIPPAYADEKSDPVYVARYKAFNASASDPAAVAQ